MIRRAHVLLLAVACGAAVAAQQPPRDSTRPVAGTATIGGRVFIDGDAQRPARRVRVTLTNVAKASPGLTATTDDNGAFVFRGLPAGRFELQAFKNAYLRASYGASRPDRSGTPIVVKDGETIANLQMAIAHGGAITGVVRDGGGRPAPGLSVRVLKLGYNAVSGERTLVTPGSFNAAVTDDRGEYRAFGLPPGGYVVVVAPQVSGRGNDAIRVLTAAEVQQALRGAAVSAPASSPVARVNYAPVFYPGTTEIGAAATIPVALGEERAGIDIAMQLVPTATISGIVSSPTGALPPMLSVRLVPAGGGAEMLNGAGLRGLSALPTVDGRYAFSGVAPGSYTVRATVGTGRGAPPNTPIQWAAADVNVSGQDLDVPLVLQPGVSVAGRVVFDGAAPTPAEIVQMSFALVPPASGVAPSSGGGRVDAEGKFTFAGVTPDSYRFTTTWNAPNATERWTLKSSAANGRDAFEAPLRVSSGDPLNWTVTFTDKPTAVAGVLKEPGGRPATDYYILVFSTDRQHWTPGSRRVRMTRPATDGSYSVKGLPAGEYFLAAPADLESGEWNDPVLLDQLVRASARITLRDGETTTQDFRVGGG